MDDLNMFHHVSPCRTDGVVWESWSVYSVGVLDSEEKTRDSSSIWTDTEPEHTEQPLQSFLSFLEKVQSNMGYFIICDVLHAFPASLPSCFKRNNSTKNVNSFTINQTFVISDRYAVILSPTVDPRNIKKVSLSTEPKLN